MTTYKFMPHSNSNVNSYSKVLSYLESVYIIALTCKIEILYSLEVSLPPAPWYSLNRWDRRARAADGVCIRRETCCSAAHAELRTVSSLEWRLPDNKYNIGGLAGGNLQFDQSLAVRQDV